MVQLALCWKSYEPGWVHSTANPAVGTHSDWLGPYQFTDPRLFALLWTATSMLESRAFLPDRSIGLGLVRSGLGG